MGMRGTTRETPAGLVLLLCAALLAPLILSAGCSAPEQEISLPHANESTFAHADQAAIYELVVRQITGPDSTVEGDGAKAAVYLVRTTDDSVGDPGLERKGLGSVPVPVQEMLISSLSGFATEVTWVDTFDDVKRDSSTGTVPGGGFIVQLGSIEVLDDGSVRVPASVYFGNLGSTGKTYLLEAVDGKWVLSGDTGAQWVS